MHVLIAYDCVHQKVGQVITTVKIEGNPRPLVIQPLKSFYWINQCIDSFNALRPLRTSFYRYKENQFYLEKCTACRIFVGLRAKHAKVKGEILLKLTHCL